MNPTTAENLDTIGAHLADELTVGEPDVAGPLAVFPLFGPEPKRQYLAFAEAAAHGVEIRELTGAASVRDLLVANSIPHDVLLFEGEEVLDAQQNRSLDLSVLVAAGTQVKIPVSCVEAGRWDGARHAESMRPAPQASHPRLRRMKAAQARQQAMAGLEARADQSAVWDEAERLADEHGVDAPTGATHDVYESRRDRLDEICAAIPLHDGQVGAIAAHGNELAVLDYVSSPTAFGELHRRLVQGYALDALAGAEDAAPDAATARGFALLVSDSRIAHRERGVGLGENVRFAAGGVAGSGLVADGELIQLTAFPGEEPGGSHERVVRRGRISRPSRRRDI